MGERFGRAAQGSGGESNKMWNLIIRDIAFLLFVAALVLFLRDKRSKKRRRRGVALAATLIATITLSLCRIENVFYTFSTVESVAEYACGDDVNCIVDGKSSSLILYTDEGSYTMMIAPRQKSGYKIGTDIRRKIISKNIGNGYIVYILGYMGIEDHYIYIRGLSDTSGISVEDSCNSKFVEFKQEDDLGNVKVTDYMALAFIEEYTEGYTVTITSGGESMTISL